MLPTAINPNIPAIGHSYSAFRLKAGKKAGGEKESVIYRGYQNGRYHISDGTNEYFAKRISATDSEPVFQFNESETVK